MNEHRLELADVFRKHETDFLTVWGLVLSPSQKKALRDIRDCRTSALGGHVEEYDCGHRVILYNSCLMGSNSLWGSLWGAGPCNKCEATTRRHFPSPLKPALAKADSSTGSPLNLILRPKTIRSCVFAQERREALVTWLARKRHRSIFEIIIGIGSDAHIDS